jgi:formylglycine-generating enzyme required for sulfatase activity
MRVGRMKIMRLAATAAAVSWSSIAVQAGAADIQIDARSVLFYPPSEVKAAGPWRQALRRWRTDARAALNYDDRLYRRPDLLWTQRDFNCGFILLWDERWWDWRAGRFTWDEFLKDGQERFGGYDSVVLWHAFPRIGFDDRNQFDFYRDLPGGLKGLRELVRDLHRSGVKVLVDYNPWDVGTRREPTDDVHALARLVKSVDADGIFLDTLSHGSPRFRPVLDAARPGVALEPELSLPVEEICRHHLSWAQWDERLKYAGPVGVARNKWFEQRHMLHLTRRLDRDHTAELHAAWMNGVGMMVWENVFGQVRVWSPRDASILRAMVGIQRRFSNHFLSGVWTPLVATRAQGVYASRWDLAGVSLWTLVNRSQKSVEGILLEVEQQPDRKYYDLIRGRPIEPKIEHGKALLAGILRPRGIGAFLAGPQGKLGEGFSRFLDRQMELEGQADFRAETPVPPETLRQVRPTRPYTKGSLPPDMVPIPAATFTMQVKFNRWWLGEYRTPVRRTVTLPPYAIDETPVTNAAFARFLKESKYKPKHPENFLRHWMGGGPPKGQEDHPVVYVDLDDARAYAAWAGKRLPTEEEWQYAAAGPDGLAYPWGNQFDAARCNGGQSGSSPTPVRAFPAGRSPLGVYDMCGNVWQWTESERQDGHNRFCVLKGGSFYKAVGSGWYADGGPQPNNLAAKFFLMWPGLDRSATIGFRCVVDLADSPRH